MKWLTRVFPVCAAIALVLVLLQPQTKTAKAQSQTAGTATIEGLVRDIACPIQNKEATATHLNMKCLLSCVKNGSPIVILTKDGDLYVPISTEMPDKSEHDRLMPFLGKYVRVSGNVYERNGAHAIAISQIKEMKNVHLTIDDQ